MQTIQSKLYTNVILTVIAMLLAVMVFQRTFTVTTTAHAQRESVDIDNSAQEAKRKKDLGEYGIGTGDKAVAAANEQIAKSNQDIADAIRESGKLQAEALEGIGLALAAIANPEGQ